MTTRKRTIITTAVTSIRPKWKKPTATRIYRCWECLNKLSSPGKNFQKWMLDERNIIMATVFNPFHPAVGYRAVFSRRRRAPAGRNGRNHPAAQQGLYPATGPVYLGKGQPGQGGNRENQIPRPSVQTMVERFAVVGRWRPATSIRRPITGVLSKISAPI